MKENNLVDLCFQFKNVTKNKSKKIKSDEQNVMENDTEISQSNSIDHHEVNEIISTIPNEVVPPTVGIDNNHPGSSENSTDPNVCGDFEALNISNDCSQIHNECDETISNDEADETISDDEDAAFFNDELFTKTNTTTIMSAPIHTFQSQDDSDTETEPFEDIKLFIDKSRSTPLAEYNDTEYRIGFLDLTDIEHSHLKLIPQTSVTINARSSSIFIHDNRFNIKRINERQMLPNEKSRNSVEMYEKFNLDRIQFASNAPLAKYQNDIYFVGQKLYTEYNNLLERTNKPAGTPIRINNDRLVIDVATQTLELRQGIFSKNRTEVCVIKGTFDSHKLQNEYCMNRCRRFVICNNSDGFEIFEVKPELLHSSIFDDYDEIYAELDFPVSATERVEELVKQITIAFRPTTSTKKLIYDHEDE